MKIVKMVGVAGYFMAAAFGFFMSIPAWIDIEEVRSLLFVMENHDTKSFMWWIMLPVVAYFNVMMIILTNTKL